jgi:hypothetical protein
MSKNQKVETDDFADEVLRLLVQRLAELEDELAGTRPQTASREKLLARREYWQSLLREGDNLATRLEHWRLVESPESPP